MRTTRYTIFNIATSLLIIGGLVFFHPVFSAFNEQINYQGKLTDSSSVAVADGAYDVVFKLYTAAGGGVAAWTESWTSAALWTDTSIDFTNDGCAAGVDKVAYTSEVNESTLAAGQLLWNTTLKQSAVVQSVDTGSNFVCVYDTFSAWSDGNDATNRVYVKNGLFSVMLGTITTLSSLNFNQTLYLGVTIGADSEMKPRKVLGAAPAAFEAKKLSGNTWAVPAAIGFTTPNTGAFSTLSASGVFTTSNGSILSSASGVLTLGGTGGGNNENLTINFESVANTVTFGTGTGVAGLDFGALNLATTGTLGAGGDNRNIVNKQQNRGRWRDC